MPDLISRKWSHYAEAYAREFASYQPRAILEIGVASGGSLHQWARTYPNAKVVGLDIDPRCRAAAGDRVAVEIGNQKDPSFLERIIQKHGRFDLIIDDGCHRGPWQKATFQTLWPYLNAPGCYCVEDLHTAFLPIWRFGNWGGSFLAYAQRYLTDELYGHWRGKAGLYTRTLHRVCFYDAMVFIHKTRGRAVPAEVVTGSLDLQK